VYGRCSISLALGHSVSSVYLPSDIRADQTCRFIVYGANGAEYQRKSIIMLVCALPTNSTHFWEDMGWFCMGHCILPRRVDRTDLEKYTWL